MLASSIQRCARRLIGQSGDRVAGAPKPIRRAIPLARPDIGECALELVTQGLGSDALAMGPFAKRFEARIAALASRHERVACSSAMASLHLGVRALEIGADTTPFPATGHRRVGNRPWRT
jgi:DegT/DnrJ/EryC1/StrS aminotransferase family